MIRLKISLSSVEKDSILAMVLRGHENDLEFIETLLDEQKSKSVKFPLSVFFKMSSIKTILALMDKNDLLKVRPEAKPQLIKRQTFENIVQNKREQDFLDHVKSKSGDPDAVTQSELEDQRLKKEIFERQSKAPPKSKLDTALEKLERVSREIEDEELIGDVRRFFRELKMQRRRGQIESLEHELLRGFRRMRKLFVQGQMHSKRQRETFQEIERIYSKLVESLDKGGKDEADSVSQVGS